MEELTRGKVVSIEDHLVLRYFEDDFGKILGLPPKRDINLSIDLVPGATQNIQDTLQNGHNRVERVTNET
jgi:hypothetical protein